MQETLNIPHEHSAPGLRRKVVVIGCGLAGLAAALEASAGGAEVVMLEKRSEHERGGNTARSGGAFLVPDAASAEARQNFVTSLMTSTKGHGNEALFRLMAEHALDDVEWLEALGADFLPAYACAPPYQASVRSLAPGQFLGTPRLLARLHAAIEARGIEVRFDTRALRLCISGGGGVTGVDVATPAGPETIAADAVVLAAGGYSGNRRFIVENVGEQAGGLSLRGVDWLTGDGITMAQEAGASVRNTKGLESLHVCAVSPSVPGGGNPSRAVPYSIAVNAEGSRYVDESRGYVANGKAALAQPGQTIAVIFDAAVATMPGPRTSMTTFRNMGLDVVSAPSIGALAQAIGIPAGALEDTVRQFNASIANGRADGARPPKTAWAYPLEVAPYYALHPCKPAITLTFGGVDIDMSGRVVSQSGKAIAGLYAAGEMAGSPFHHDYLGGGSLTNCLVVGRIAGRSAASPHQGPAMHQTIGHA